MTKPKSKHGKTTNDGDDKRPHKTTFGAMGICDSTRKGLDKYKFITPTPIQSAVIPPAMEQQRDILGAAKTGSGKTLAFIIPILERLHSLNWSNHFGMAALVISPTRELAYQTYQCLRDVGEQHRFSAALVIGGSKGARRQEFQCLEKINIVVGTPGRLLEHMEKNPLFDTADLKMLVLDEADRCLDLGFAETLNAVIEHLPTKRQTLLFSATLTRSVNDLARLSLVDPLRLSVDEEAAYATPENLAQTYVVYDAHEKLNFLWSFVSHHRKKKILVFMQSCKQVRYFYQALCHLQPGISVLTLYGHQGQMKRLEMYEKFHRKQFAVLVATDVAARGLDFPDIDWVVQLDAPENENEYIHRVGRTARYTKSGSSLLVLTPREDQDGAFISKLLARRIPIERMEVAERFMRDCHGSLAAFCASRPDIKHCAQACIKAYCRSLWMLNRREEVLALDLESLAHSYGLCAAPRIRFIERANRVPAGDNSSSTPGAVSAETLEDFHDDIESDDELLVAKPISVALPAPPSIQRFNDKRSASSAPPSNDEAQSKKRMKPLSRAAAVKKLLKKNVQSNTRIVFGDDGDIAHVDGACAEEVKQVWSEVSSSKDIDYGASERLDYEQARRRLRRADKDDKKVFDNRVRQMHQEQRRQQKLDRIGTTDDDDEADDVYDDSSDVGGVSAVDASHRIVFSDSDDDVADHEQTDDKSEESTLVQREELALRLLGSTK